MRILCPVMLMSFLGLSTFAAYRIDFVNDTTEPIKFYADATGHDHYEGHVKVGEEKYVDTWGANCWANVTFTAEFPGAGGKSTVSFNPGCGSPGKIKLKEICYKSEVTETGDRCELVRVDV